MRAGGRASRRDSAELIEEAFAELVDIPGRTAREKADRRARRLKSLRGLNRCYQSLGRGELADARESGADRVPVPGRPRGVDGRRVEKRPVEVEDDGVWQCIHEA